MSADPSSFRGLPRLAAAHQDLHPASRLRKLRKAAEETRDLLLSEGQVDAFVTCSLVTYPYPSNFAFMGAALSPAPYVMLTHRMQVVQFRESGQLRTLLFNPTDYERSQAAPFYAMLRRRFGTFLSDRVFSARHGTVEGHLNRLGLSPLDVDYIAFDHLQLQDLRRWLGSDEMPGFFPRARLLVQRREWESVRDPHPLQYVWHVPEGTRGISPSRVTLLDGDIWLGKGLALLSAPGHTQGSMSLAASTPEGVFVVSDNGAATESYTPLVSGIPGIRRWAEQYGYEVILNSNTRERSLEQYGSMIFEKTLAGPSRKDPSFVNVLPSSELTRSVIAPGISPTFSHGAVGAGRVLRPEVAAEAAA